MYVCMYVCVGERGHGYHDYKQWCATTQPNMAGRAPTTDRAYQMHNVDIAYHTFVIARTYQAYHTHHESPTCMIDRHTGHTTYTYNVIHPDWQNSQMDTRIYIYIYIYTHACIHIHTHARKPTHVCMCVCKCASMRVCA